MKKAIFEISAKSESKHFLHKAQLMLRLCEVRHGYSISS